MELYPLKGSSEVCQFTAMSVNKQKAKDLTDYAPQPMRPSNWDIFWLVFSIISHFLDIGTDINVAYQYYSHNEIYYFIATIVVILVPAIVNSSVSVRMYVMDFDEVSSQMNRRMGYRFILILLQLAPVVRHFDALRYAIKSKRAEKAGNKEKQEMNYRLMLKEDADASLLRVFECFLEAAPQQILQISYLLKNGDGSVDPASFSVYHQIVSILSSLIGMAMSLMTYQRNIRFTQEDKDNISKIGSACIFFWHFFVTVSRIMMISAVASLMWLWTLIALTIHWIVMTISLSLLESHEFCSSPIFEHTRLHEQLANLLFSAVLGLVYIFTYITPGEGSTCCRYSSFYSICFIENIVGLLTYLYFVEDGIRNRWYFYPLIVFSVVPFVLGCIFMVLYYCKFHPKHYTPPSIIPQRRQRASITEPHLPPTPSPLPCGSDTVLNGDVQVIVETGLQDAVKCSEEAALKSSL